MMIFLFIAYIIHWSIPVFLLCTILNFIHNKVMGKND